MIVCVARENVECYTPPFLGAMGGLDEDFGSYIPIIIVLVILYAG